MSERSVVDSFSRYRPRPGHPDWAALDAEAAALVAGLDLAPPQPRPAFAMRRARAYATAVHNYATNLRRERAGRHDLLPLYFIWTTHRACNFACSYCDDHRGRKYPDLPKAGTLDTEQGLRLLEVMRTRTPSVYFAGGEPSMRKDLPLLARRARELAYYPIIINTNGSVVDRRLADPAWRSWLADTDIVIVSVDGLELDRLARMWRYRRPREVLRNLLVLRRLAGPMRFRLMVNCVIQPGSVGDARDVLDLACDLGIGFCPVPVNVGPSVDESLRRDPAYAELAGEILARKRAGDPIVGSLRMNRRLLAGEAIDCRNTLKPHIDHDGTLLWPCKAAVAVEPRAIPVLDFSDVDSLYEHAARQIDPTDFHTRCGARCNWAQNYSTDAYVDGLHHPASLLREVAGFLRRS